MGCIRIPGFHCRYLNDRVVHVPARAALVRRDPFVTACESLRVQWSDGQMGRAAEAGRERDEETGGRAGKERREPSPSRVWLWVGNENLRKIL
jgi:hypothetical protein